MSEPTIQLEAYLEAQVSPDHDRSLLEASGGYRGYAGWLAAWCELGRAGARISSLGSTHEGRPIVALEWGPPDARDYVLLLSGVHAMEWIGLEVGEAVARWMREQAPDKRVLYVPLLNVDGFCRAEANLVTKRHKFVRANARGVDLNRGWPTHYQRFHGPSLLFPRLGNAGSQARSEPEIDAICTELDRRKESGLRMRRALSLHSFGEVILRPWGGVFRRCEREAELLAMSEQIAAACRSPYRPKQVSRWYPGISFAHGMEIDHLYGAYGADALLVECSRGGFSWKDPSSWFHPWRWFNPVDREACVAELQAPLGRFLSGEWSEASG